MYDNRKPIKLMFNEYLILNNNNNQEFNLKILIFIIIHNFHNVCILF